MASKAQVQAHRANAQKSTGPRTPEGKLTSAQNAVKHGLFSRTGYLHGEDREEFVYHYETMFDELCPESMLEEEAVQRVVDLSWRLRRAQRCQNIVMAMPRRNRASWMMDDGCPGSESGVTRFHGKVRLLCNNQ